ETSFDGKARHLWRAVWDSSESRLRLTKLTKNFCQVIRISRLSTQNAPLLKMKKEARFPGPPFGGAASGGLAPGVDLRDPGVPVAQQRPGATAAGRRGDERAEGACLPDVLRSDPDRSEEHTSELQSRGQLVCRLL